jgi:hypothetical protein
MSRRGGPFRQPTQAGQQRRIRRRELEHTGKLGEAPVVHEEPEGAGPDVAAPDPLVTVHARTELPL